MKLSQTQIADIRNRIARGISLLKKVEAEADLGQFMDAQTSLRQMDDILIPVHLIFNQGIVPKDDTLQATIDEEYQDSGSE